MMGDRITVVRDEKDAAAAAVEGQYRRAERCPGCGMPKGSGLGTHYFGCAIDTAERAARDAKAAKAADDRSNWDANGWERVIDPQRWMR